MSYAGHHGPYDDRLDPAIWRVAAVAAIGSFMAQLDATVVNVSLSSLAEELHASIGTVQWVTSGYLLALALVLPFNGWLVDRIGAKNLYLSCFLAFTLSSALCGVAWSAGSLPRANASPGSSASPPCPSSLRPCSAR